MGDPAPARTGRLLSSRRFLAVWTGVIALLSIAAWLALPHWEWYTRGTASRVEYGRVRRADARGSQSHLAIESPSGLVELEVERPAGIFAPLALHEGERVLIRVAEGDGGTVKCVATKARDRTLVVVLGLFFVVLAVAGGGRTLRTALSLLAAFLLLAVVLVPLAIRGWDPLAVALPLAGAIATGTIFVVVGLNRKSLAALLATLVGVAAAVAVSVRAAGWLSLTGLSVDFGQYTHLATMYWQSTRVGHINFANLLVAGMVLSCLGAAMDVAITVATAVHEVVANRPGISRREAIRGGLTVGRAAVWMTAATLFFVLLGAGMAPFLARSLRHAQSGWARLMSFEELAAEVVRLATAGLTMTLVAPLSAVLSGLLMAGRARTGPRRRAAEAPGSRARPQPAQAPTLRPTRALVPLGFGIVLVLGLVLVDRLALRSIPIAADEPDEAGFFHEEALGRVAKLRGPHIEEGSEKGAETRGRPLAWQLAACQLLTGKLAGRVVLCDNLVHPNPDKNLVVREGELAVVQVTARGREEPAVTGASLRNPALRYRSLLWLLGALFVALLLFGGWRSARNTLGVAGIVAALFVGVFPLLAQEAPPLATVAVFSAGVVLGVLLLFYGWDRKALAALAGTAGALLVVAVVLAAASRGLKLYGLDAPAARWLVWLERHGRVALDYHGLLLAGLLVAVVGVAIDTSVSIAAGIEELYRAHPTIERQRAFASGLAIGRDVMGVCATTFVFASIGVRLPALLLPAASGLSPAELVNAEAGCIEIVRILACGIGLLATAPLTTLAAVMVFSRGGGRRPARPPRDAARWTRRALAAEALAIVGLGAAIAMHPPFAPQEPPSFASLEEGTPEAVEEEANALIEAPDYPLAILLLWEAQERGIAPARLAVRLRRLYSEHQEHTRRCERAGRPEWRPPQRLHRAAAGGWVIHALAELRAAVEREPGHFGANLELGRLLRDLGRAREAIPHLQAARRAEPGNVGLLCELAAACATVGQLDDAGAALRAALAQEPGHFEANLRLGRLLCDRDRAKEAIAHLEAARRAKPQHVGALTQLATAHLMAGRHGEAEAELRRALRQQPEHFEANFCLGRLLCDRGRSAEAIPYLQAARAADREHLGVLCELAGAHAAIGQLAKAEAAFRMALARDPADREASFKLGRVLCYQDRAPEAIVHLQAAVDAEGDKRGPLCDLAAAHAMAGQLVEATAVAARLERLVPGALTGRQLVGRLLCSWRRPRAAIPLLKAAAADHPANVELLCDLAAAHLTAAEPDKARAIAEKLQRLAADNPRVRELLDAVLPRP